MRISTLIVTAVAGIAALSAIGGAVVVQEGGALSEHFALIVKHLHLTPSQEKVMKVEHEAAAKRLAAIDADPTLDQAGKQKAKQALHNELMTKAKTILSAKQMKDLTVMMKLAKEQHQMMAILSQLNLSKDQQDEIHKLTDDTIATMEKIHDDPKLSDAQKKQQAEKVHNDVMQKIHSILTPEQMQKAMELHHGGVHNIPRK